MKKIMVFGSKHCPDCQGVKEYLSENGIKCTYVDITDNMYNLKLYLKYRDNRPEFDEIKKLGKVGIPLIIVNDGEKLYFEMPDPAELR